MFILCVDPGIANLGLAVVKTRTRGSPQILWSETIRVGTMAQPQSFGERLWPKLEGIRKAYPELGAVATEAPPVQLAKRRGSGRRSKVNLSKTVSCLARVSGIIQGWAVCHGLEYAEITPLQLKRFCAKVLGQAYSQADIPDKAAIAEAVERTFGERTRDNHSDDAALIGAYFAAA